MDEFLSDDAENRYQIYDLHKSLGMVVLLMLILRVFNRILNKPPLLPQSISPLEQKLAKLGHYILYILMLTTPLSGYLMSSFAGYPVKLFSIEIPNLVGANYEMAKICSEAHELSAYSLLAMVAIHILAVIKHRFFDKPENNVLKRII